jgi:hypothetical protein
MSTVTHKIRLESCSEFRIDEINKLELSGKYAKETGDRFVWVDDRKITMTSIGGVTTTPSIFWFRGGN